MALPLARQNAGNNQVADRIQFHQSDTFASLPADLQFDLIVSNPPYIPHAAVSDLGPEVRNFDPASALDGGPDGLEAYRRIAAGGPAHLAQGGRILVETIQV